MCIECQQNPCHSSCPNAPSQFAFKCTVCGDEICEGDIYYEDAEDEQRLCECCGAKIKNLNKYYAEKEN